jgi:hypothetical protein
VMVAVILGWAKMGLSFWWKKCPFSWSLWSIIARNHQNKIISSHPL